MGTDPDRFCGDRITEFVATKYFVGTESESWTNFVQSVLFVATKSVQPPTEQKSVGTKFSDFCSWEGGQNLLICPFVHL